MALDGEKCCDCAPYNCTCTCTCACTCISSSCGSGGGVYPPSNDARFGASAQPPMFSERIISSSDGGAVASGAGVGAASAGTSVRGTVGAGEKAGVVVLSLAVGWETIAQEEDRGWALGND